MEDTSMKTRTTTALTLIFSLILCAVTFTTAQASPEEIGGQSASTAAQPVNQAAQKPAPSPDPLTSIPYREIRPQVEPVVGTMKRIVGPSTYDVIGGDNRICGGIL
jgi:hypothetical protein